MKAFGNLKVGDELYYYSRNTWYFDTFTVKEVIPDPPCKVKIVFEDSKHESSFYYFDQYAIQDGNMWVGIYFFSDIDAARYQIRSDVEDELRHIDFKINEYQNKRTKLNKLLEV